MIDDNDSNSQVRVTENKYVKLWVEDGIIMEIFKKNLSIITLPMAKQIVSDRLKVSNGITMPIFIDSVNVKNMDKEAREYFASA